MSTPLKKLQQALNAMRVLLPDGTLNHLYVFLEIARSPDPIETRDLPDRLSITQTTTSRTVRTLAEGSYLRGGIGLGLIEMEVLKEDARQRTVKLSTKGKMFAKQLEEILK